MVLEEQDQKFSNSSSASGGGGGGSGCSRFVKKQKQNKFPQRGPGVAVLEKIRIEEQEKDAEFIDVTPNLHLSNQSSSSSIPFLYPSPIDYPLSMFKSIVPLPNPKGLPAISVTGHGNVTKLSNSYYCSLEMDSPYESNPTWPPFQKVMQKMQQYQQPSSMVNVPSETSSSSVQNFQMEPPSNQKYYSNYIPWPPEEERMVGMKRPCPFSIGNPLGSSIYPNLHINVHPHSRSDDSSLGNELRLDFEPGNNISRQGPSSSISISESKTRESIKKTGVLSGDFLTLAPPGVSSNSLSSISKSPRSTLLTLRNFEKLDFASLPFQGTITEGPQLQPFYTFLPPAKVRKGRTTSTKNEDNDEAEEKIDLKLKL